MNRRPHREERCADNIDLLPLAILNSILWHNDIMNWIVICKATFPRAVFSAVTEAVGRMVSLNSYRNAKNCVEKAWNLMTLWTVTVLSIFSKLHFARQPKRACFVSSMTHEWAKRVLGSFTRKLNCWLTSIFVILPNVDCFSKVGLEFDVFSPLVVQALLRF